MYKKKIEQYIEAHKQEMLDDICTMFFFSILAIMSACG